MQSRLFREGSLGLLILSGIVGFSGLFFWIFNFQVGEQGYGFTVKFVDAGGLLNGAAVRLRGVEVGRVEGITTRLDAVDVNVTIGSSGILIPANSEFLAAQTGLIGQTTLDIVPLTEGDGVTPITNESEPTGSDGETLAGPLDEACDPDVIVCNGAEEIGAVGVNYAQLVQRIDSLISSFDDGGFSDNLNSVATSVTDVADSVTILAESIQQDLDIEAISGAATAIRDAANNLNGVLASNQASLTATLTNLETFSQDASEISAALQPLLTDETFVQDLTTISANAAAATEDLKAVTATLNDPDVIVNIRTALDSARVTFENAEKITTDLETLTGDLEFLESLKNLVFGLDGLVSYQPIPGIAPHTIGASNAEIRLNFTPVELTSLESALVGEGRL
ncbi:MAG: MlaD family protein [Cyanobacteria bacterium P01_E01_bin.34]